MTSGKSQNAGQLKFDQKELHLVNFQFDFLDSALKIRADIQKEGSAVSILSKLDKLIEIALEPVSFFFIFIRC